MVIANISVPQLQNWSSGKERTVSPMREPKQFLVSCCEYTRSRGRCLHTQPIDSELA